MYMPLHCETNQSTDSIRKSEVLPGHYFAHLLFAFSAVKEDNTSKDLILYPVPNDICQAVGVLWIVTISATKEWRGWSVLKLMDPRLFGIFFCKRVKLFCMPFLPFYMLVSTVVQLVEINSDVMIGNYN